MKSNIAYVVCVPSRISRNWITDHFEIRKIKKVANVIPGLNSFFFSKCGMCWVFTQQVTYWKTLDGEQVQNA